ncbi:MAG: Lrp/AsnC family transcriptional regulator [Aestuariibacter sp.]
MDAFDYEILMALQEDCRISTEALGDKVGLSASACQRRIKKLKTEGIINREVAILNRDRIPGYSAVIVDVILDTGGENALDKFIIQLQQAEQVQQFYYVAGEIDFVVILVVKNMEEYDLLSRQLFMSNSNVKKFTSKVAIKSHKTSLKIPLKS